MCISIDPTWNRYSSHDALCFRIHPNDVAVSAKLCETEKRPCPQQKQHCLPHCPIFLFRVRVFSEYAKCSSCADQLLIDSSFRMILHKSCTPHEAPPAGKKVKRRHGAFRSFGLFWQMIRNPDSILHNKTFSPRYYHTAMTWKEKIISTH